MAEVINLRESIAKDIATLCKALRISTQSEYIKLQLQMSQLKKYDWQEIEKYLDYEIDKSKSK